ncbi:large ribosomal subunit protein uL1-like [Haemaphysalis longicornis]
MPSVPEAAQDRVPVRVSSINSRVPTERLHSRINEVIWEWVERPARKKREKMLVLIGVGRRRSKRGISCSASVKLKHVPKRFFRVCVLGDEKHCREATAASLPRRGIATILEIRKDKLRVPKLGSKFDGFLASPSVMKELSDGLLSALTSADKSPIELAFEESLSAQIYKLNRSTNFEKSSAYSRMAKAGYVKI